MPRPRSSTFYLPLAPIDANLELKAKLSVLPPSAANALLAPRHNTYLSHAAMGSGSGLAGGGGGPCGFSRSATTTTGSSINNMSGSASNTSGSYMSGSGCTFPLPEDECTRLNRVLGILPSASASQHTHIPLPHHQSLQSNNITNTSTSNTSNARSINPTAAATTATNLGVPSTGGIGRRRHTDAPKPSFPLSLSPLQRPRPRSPLAPAVSKLTPSSHAHTGSTDWAEYIPVSKSPKPVADRGGTSSDPSQISAGEEATLVEPEESRAPTERVPAAVSLASIPDNQPRDEQPSPLAALTSATTTTTTGVTTMDQDSRDAQHVGISRGVETEIAEGMAWTFDTSETPQDCSAMVHGRPRVDIDVGHGAADMDMFARACEVQNPVVHGSGRPAHTPRPSFSSTTAAPSSYFSTISTPATTNSTSASSSICSASSSLLASSAPPYSTSSTRTLPPTPPPLSCIPCGMHSILACRAKVKSRFAPSPSPQPSRPVTARSSRPPSTSTSASRPSTSTSSRPTSSRPTSIAPPPTDSLHPRDTRHLLRPQFRLPFPPPPAPSSLPAKVFHPREKVCVFVDESIPGLAGYPKEELDETLECDSSDTLQYSSDSLESSFNYYSSHTPTQPKAPPRQRFRLAPCYLPKVLRRSLGATAWARAETLRTARAAERGFGWDMGVLSASGQMPMLDGAVPLNFNGTAEGWPSAFVTTNDNGNGYTNANANVTGDGWMAGSMGGAWWGRLPDVPGSTGVDNGNSLVWSGYEDVYEGGEDMEGIELDGPDDPESTSKGECIWDWDEEDVEPVLVQGQDSEAMESQDEFVREGAPEPEDRHPYSPAAYSPQSSPSSSVQTPGTPTEPESIGYSMVGKFGWDTTWPASPTSPGVVTSAEATHYPSIDIPGLDLTPITLGLPPLHRRTVRREDGAESEDDEEEIFRYSPLKIEDDHGLHSEMDVEVEGHGLERDVQDGYLRAQSMSSCSTPTATSPSFPPGPLRGVTISSSFDEGYLDADGDAEMEDTPARNVVVSRPPIRAPRPLSIAQHPVLYHEYASDPNSPPPSSVFIIPPSPLTTTTFDGSGTGSSTPTSATAPSFPDRMEEEGDLSNVGWGPAPVEHSLSPKRSYERIVAPRPQRVTRGLEQVSTAPTSSPMFRTSALAQSSPPASPPSSTSSPRWTFGSLKSALSNSMSHLVELARSRSPSPLPWLMRGSALHTGATLSGAAAALDASHRRDGSEEELDLERSTGCVTPTPAAAAGSHSRRSSTTTITDVTKGRHRDGSFSAPHLPVLKLQVENASADALMSESPPPKRTLSTSSLSSLGSEPDSESGSSGGIFSRSPSPEPTSDSRIWDPSYTLTPRSRPISADAKAASACGGRLSPMMIPGSWDPAELWAEEGDLAKTW